MPGPAPLLTPRLGESVRLPDALFAHPEGHRQVREFQRDVSRTLNEFRDQYLNSIRGVIETLTPLAAAASGEDGGLSAERRAELGTALGLGLAAGQLEDAHGIAPGPEQTNPAVHSALAVMASEFDVLGAYHLYVGHFLGRQRGEGLDRVIEMLRRDHPELP